MEIIPGNPATEALSGADWRDRIKRSKLRTRLVIYVCLLGPVVFFVGFFALFPQTAVRTPATGMALCSVLSVAGFISALIIGGTRESDVKELLKNDAITILPHVLSFLVLIAVQKGIRRSLVAQLRNHVFQLLRAYNGTTVPELSYEQQVTFIRLYEYAEPSDQALLFDWAGRICSVATIPVIKGIVDGGRLAPLPGGDHVRHHATRCLSEIMDRNARVRREKEYLRAACPEVGNLMRPAADPRSNLDRGELLRAPSYDSTSEAEESRPPRGSP